MTPPRAAPPPLLTPPPVRWRVTYTPAGTEVCDEWARFALQGDACAYATRSLRAQERAQGGSTCTTETRGLGGATAWTLQTGEPPALTLVGTWRVAYDDAPEGNPA